LYQSGQFTREVTLYVWGILAGSAVGLLASTLGRLYASTYYAMGDTRTPLRYAALRVALTIVLGYLCALPLPPALGLDQRWGAAGLTVSAGLAGWIEFLLLRRSLNRRIGPSGLPASLGLRLWGAAVLAAAVAWLVRPVLPGNQPLLTAAVVLTVYGGLYLLGTTALGVDEAARVLGRLTKR
jgi:putative peptidoglycan lipid II flippase